MVIDMDGVRVVFPDEMGQKEALGYLREQLTLKPALRLSRLDIVIDGAEAVLCPHYDTVRRVRRVTGYLSALDNFTAAKKDEVRARERHV